MSPDKLTPERAVRLLRAKANELEIFALRRLGGDEDIDTIELGYLAADISLVATMLADLIESGQGMYDAGFMAAMEHRRDQCTGHHGCMSEHHNFGCPYA